MDLPPCGLYRTTVPIGDIPAPSLVYFHNHGDPGPGIYLPETWELNRAEFSDEGTTLPDDDAAETLVPLPDEGFYRVTEEFPCCSKNCRIFEEDLFVQLGYDGTAQPILFVPEWTSSGMCIPELGQRIDDEHLDKLAPLQVAESDDEDYDLPPPGEGLH